MSRLGEPPLYPPDTPDLGESCAECPVILGPDAVEVEKPGRERWSTPVWVCSEQCATEYLADYADYMYDRMNQ